MPRSSWAAVVARNHWPLAITLAGLLGLVEGALTSSTGESGAIGRWTYWGILFALPMVGLAASIGITRALAHLPIVIVVQDWLSLVAQNKEPRNEHWYSAVFGDNVLTQHTAYLPNFYYIGFIASLLAHIILDIYTERNAPTPASTSAPVET